jgi:hypothetical protein
VRIFIEKFAEIARPLVQLTWKDVEFVWGEEQHDGLFEAVCCDRACAGAH